MMTNTPPLKEIIDEFDLGAKKSLGQHFLLDLNITHKIARLAGVEAGDLVLEIGPGPGGLTRALLAAGAEVVAVERDARCVAALETLHEFYPGKLCVIEGDALSINEPAILEQRTAKIIANLPYNISTELLIKWLKQGNMLWSRMALMFQKEVADRILAVSGTKAYGRLSIISQAASTPARAFDLPPQAFTPPPKVSSSVVLFDPPAVQPKNLDALEHITRAAFSQRRKMLRTSLKPVFGDRLEKALDAAGVRGTQRAEEISVDQFKTLAALYADKTS